MVCELMSPQPEHLVWELSGRGRDIMLQVRQITGFGVVTVKYGTEIVDVEYLQRILASRVYDVVQETPLQHAPRLSMRLGNEVLFKREDLQPIFSFKLRGAYNRMARMAPHERQGGVITASAGNHAQGVAFSGQKLGVCCVIVMPVTTPAIKVQACHERGAEIVLFGDSYSEAEAHAYRLRSERGLTFVHPYDDPEVIAG